MDIKLFEVGDLVNIKIGKKAMVLSVIKEIRNEQGTVIQELTPDQTLYQVCYEDNNGSLIGTKIMHVALEPYVA